MPPDIDELIWSAFWAAHEKGKSDWWRMTTAVLKNRLLLLTDRQFNEQDFGARTMLEFAAKFPDLLWLDTTTFPPEVELRVLRIRSDLWTAVTDHKTGTKYVWDRALRIARKATDSDPSEFILPTISADELTQWRQDFANRHRSTFSAADSKAADQWARRGWFHRSLPDRLKGIWSRERSWRVWDRLNRWFATRLSQQDIPSLSESLEQTSQSEWAGSASAAESETAISDSTDDELKRCRNLGDWLAVGELLSARFPTVTAIEFEDVFAQVVASWAQPVQQFSASSVPDVVAHLAELDPDQAATAIINACYRVRMAGRQIPDAVSDLAFKLLAPIQSNYSIADQRSPMALCLAAVAKLGSAYDNLKGAVQGFLATNTTTAKAASIAVLRAAHALRPLSLAAERPFLRELDTLLGATFRKFCESCEKHAAEEIGRRAEDLRQQSTRLSASLDDTRYLSLIWTTVIRPVAVHVSKLLEDGTRTSEELSRPALAITSGTIKTDLFTPQRPTTVSATITNSGLGRAIRIDVAALQTGFGAELELIAPPRPFDLPGAAAQVLTFSLIVQSPSESLAIPLTWICSDTAGKRYEFLDELRLIQQAQQPNWDALILDPPYTINPVTQKTKLFGRDAILQRLLLHATGATSTFLWGQKRVGKTSVLQVLAAELERTNRVACAYLRMGELIALHEGQIAHTIASRLSEKCGLSHHVPSEEYFGAGLSKLVPIAERLRQLTESKLVVIVDEFDDLDSAFYTGERGRQFVKALRSLSEVGITFFFVGSERMDAIYNRHAVELNKWVNISLDRIEAFADCKELIEKPVSGNIEYEDAAVSFIVSYCGGNPFYMHLFCFETFKRCVEDHRTFVSATDVHVVRQHLLRTLGKTNFAHFWEDNPELLDKQQVAQAAENTLTLACIASLGGKYEELDELAEAQESLGLAASELAGKSMLARSVDRLKRRRVLSANEIERKIEIDLPIFREWLTENVEQILPTWQEFVRRENQSTTIAARPASLANEPTVQFPIPEDALLAVSQRLVYCGKQKDVAEVRRWLRQFDDDNRIEVAFSLLRRLAEKGYVTEGARGRTLTMLEDALQDRRNSVGSGTWKVIRGRKDNLCIAYVDSETKSGAVTAREIAKRLRPGKVADCESIAPWIRAHTRDDALILIVDDFSGTGSTLELGIGRFFEYAKRNGVESFLSEGRVSCYCQFAFPEALERLKRTFAGIEFLSAHVFGDDVRSLDAQAELFETENDRNFAREILLQIGRELMPQSPLGWGDMGALVAFHNTIPNNTLPIFWCEGTVNERQWLPLLPRA